MNVTQQIEQVLINIRERMDPATAQVIIGLDELTILEGLVKKTVPKYEPRTHYENHDFISLKGR